MNDMREKMRCASNCRTYLCGAVLITTLCSAMCHAAEGTIGTTEPLDPTKSGRDFLSSFCGAFWVPSSEAGLEAARRIHADFSFGSVPGPSTNRADKILGVPHYMLGWGPALTPDEAFVSGDSKPAAGSHVCFNSPSWRQRILPDLEKYITNTPMDALLLDAVWWGAFGRPEDWCCCQHCQRQFKEKFGKELPITRKFEFAQLDPQTARQAIEWRQNSLEEFARLIQAKAKSLRPDLPINFHGQGAFFIDRGNFFGPLSLLKLSDFNYWEWYGDELFYSALLRGLSPKPVFGHAPYQMEAVTEGPAACWPGSAAQWLLAGYSDDYCDAIVAGMLAHGCRPIMHVPWNPEGGLNQNAVQLMEPLFRKVHEKEPYLRKASPIPYAAIVYSDTTKIYYPRDDLTKSPLPHLRGAFQILQRLRLPARFLGDFDLDAETLRKFRAVIFPNTAILSKPQVEAITQYVRDGGTILCTFETGLHDESGQRKGNFDLADVLGLQYVSARNYEAWAKSVGCLVLNGNFMVSLQKLLAPRQNTSLFMPGPCIQTRSLAGVTKADLTMGEPETIPAIHINAYGRGKAAYISTPLFKNYLAPANPPALPKEVNIIPYARRGWTTELVRELLNELAPDPPLKVESGPMLEATFFEQKEQGRIVVHLLNASVRELGKAYPLEQARILIRKDFAAPRRAYTAWPEKKDLILENKGQYIEIVAPETRIHQIVALER